MNKTCHITSTLHVYCLTFTTGDGWGGGGVTDDKATKLVTAVQDDILAFERVNLLDFSGERPRGFSTCTCETTGLGIFDRKLDHLQWRVWR